MKITLAGLKRKGACAPTLDFFGLSLFGKEWPEECEISEATLQRAAALKLDLDWFAKNLLSAAARLEFKRQTAPALGELWRQTPAAWAEFRRQQVAALWGLLKDEGEV